MHSPDPSISNDLPKNSSPYDRAATYTHCAHNFASSSFNSVLISAQALVFHRLMYQPCQLTWTSPSATRRHSGFRNWLRRRRSTLSTRCKLSSHTLDSRDAEIELCSSDASLTLESIPVGPIEKGSKDGQGQYADDLVKALKAGVSSGSRARAGSKGKKAKKGKKGEAQAGGEAAASGSKGRPGKKEEDWGLLDALRPILGPVVDPIKPLFSARSLCVLLLFLFTVSWFRNSRMRASTRQLDLASGTTQWTGPSGYDNVWRNEEEALWKWLEERVAMKDGVPAVKGDKTNADTSKQARKARQQILRGRGDPDSMSAREIEYALRVTKEKLDRLESLVGAQSEGHEKQAEAPAGTASERQA